MRVTALGHASVLLEADTECVLIDPIFDAVFASGTLCLHPARDIDGDALIALTTALVITHIHLDHFHPPTLSRFPRNLRLFVPAHDALLNALLGLGFTNVTALQPWAKASVGAITLIATPSDFEFEELGVVAVAGADSYWHMSDAIVTPEIGARVLGEIGPVSLLSVKFQPLRTLIAYQRGLASTMLDREDLLGSFEAACAAQPACLFPYYSGFAFHGAHAWANRHISPYRAEEIAALMARRMGGASTVTTVLPGDVFVVEGRRVEKLPAASPHLHCRATSTVQAWEPIDPTTLIGVSAPLDIIWLTLELRRLLAEEVLPWVQAHLDQSSGLFDSYREFQAVWQAVVHLGAERRLYYAIDFSQPRATLLLEYAHPAANVFSHVAGGSLLQVLRGTAGAEVFWMAGGYRIYEKIIYVADGRFHAPPYDTWDIYEHLPDPLTHFLRRVPRKALVTTS